LLDTWLAADDLAGFFSEHEDALLSNDVQAAISPRTDEPGLRADTLVSARAAKATSSASGRS